MYMKKLIVCALLLGSGQLFAQGFQLGIKGGVNISNFTGGNFNQVKESSLVGFHGGGFVSFLVGDNFAIQPEVLFSSQGAQLENAGNKENFRVSYVIVPVMAKFRFPGGFYLEAGPQVGFKVDETAPGQVIGNTTIGNFAKDLDLAVDAGLGFHSKGGIGIGGRYVAGISKVGDFNGQNINPDFKNGVIQVFVFFTLFNNKH
jgi:Outer membrane protein beta-barrel domain